MTRGRRWTDGREVIAYIGAHLVGIAGTFAFNPAIFQAMSRAGHADKVYSVSLGIAVFVTLVVLGLFLGIRRLLHKPSVSATPSPTMSRTDEPAVLAPPAPDATAQLQSGTPGTLLGILALVFGVLGLLPAFGLILSIAGLTCGLIGRGQAKRAGNGTGATLSLIGIILSAITLVIAAVALIFLGGLAGWMSASASVGRFAGRYTCEGYNSYEVRQDLLVVNGRTLRDITLTAEGGNRLRVSHVAAGGIAIENTGGAYVINGQRCEKLSG